MNSLTPSAGAGEPLALSAQPARPRLLSVARGSLLGGAALAFAGLAGSLLVAYATRWGPWAFSDGAGYIILARNLLRGRGLGLMRASGEFHPLSLHPPLFPLTLAAFGFAGADLAEVARWLNAALFGITIVLGGVLVYRATGRRWLGPSAGLTLLASPLLVYLFSGAMSEPLFFVLTLGSLIALQGYTRRRERIYLVAAGIASGLALITRYPGVALLAPGVVAILASRARDWKGKAVDCSLFVGLAGAPMLAWLGWLSAQPGADPPRQWTWDLTDLLSRVRPVVEGVGYALWDWLPFSGWASDRSIPFKQALLALIVVVVVALTVLAYLRLRSGLPRTWHSDPSVLLGLLLGTFALAYFGQLTFTYLFSLPALDPSDIDQRILAPILVAIGLYLFVLAELLMRSATSRRWLAIVPSGLLLLYAAWFLPQAWNIASSLHQAGAGYTSQSWRSSPTIAALQALPTQTPIITNESAAVMLWLDRPAYDFRMPAADQPGSALDRFGDSADELASIFREQGAALVLFNSISAQLAGSYGEEGAGTRLAALTQGLELFARLEDGQVFFYPIEEESE